MRASLEHVVSEFERLKRISSQELEQERLAKLQSLVRYHYEKNRVYKAMLDKIGVRPGHLKTLSDLRLLPIVTTDDILRNGASFFTEPENNRTLLRTSGSTGRSKRIPVHIGEESRRIAENVALGFYITGIKGDGEIYCTFPCGPWPSAFFAHNGGELIASTEKGDMTQPIERHINTIQESNPLYFMSSPSFASFFATEVSKTHDVRSLGFKHIMLAGEPFGENFRKRLEETFKAPVLDLYGCAEISAASMECPELRATGLHHILAHEIVIEVRKIGTENEILLPEEQGEMIVTPLFKTAIPIIRYEMKDIVTLADPSKRCSCGLNLPLISRIQGRTDDMLKYGGACIYPDMFYAVLDTLGLGDKFQVVKDKDDSGLKDKMVITVEAGVMDTLSEGELSQRVERGLRRVSAELEYVFVRNLVNPISVNRVGYGKLYKGTGKLNRFVDRTTS